MVDHAQNRLNDTVAAIATPPGRGGVGIIRISGPDAVDVGHAITGQTHFQPRYAYFSPFLDAEGSYLDRGLILFFPGPHSFTGEDVIELHTHGGPVVLRQVLNRLLGLGIREAGPGEFSRRAFLNGRLDLSQAEGIASLIDAETESSARAALRTVDGELGKASRKLADGIQKLRVWVEGSLDFPDDDIQELDERTALERLESLQGQVAELRQRIERGVLLGQGGLIVLAGLPNAGKSSILNALSGREAAIVTEEAGTTRDILRERVHIDGVPVEIVDTAGLRDCQDRIEAEGVRRARNEIDQADLIVYLVDGSLGWQEGDDREWGRLPHDRAVIFHSKGDLAPAYHGGAMGTLSVFGEAGLQPLLDTIADVLGKRGSSDALGAHERHRIVLDDAAEALGSAGGLLKDHGMGDLFAREVARAHEAIGRITGDVHTEDVLDEVFNSFCVGK